MAFLKGHFCLNLAPSYFDALEAAFRLACRGENFSRSYLSLDLIKIKYEKNPATSRSGVKNLQSSGGGNCRIKRG